MAGFTWEAAHRYQSVVKHATFGDQHELSPQPSSGCLNECECPYIFRGEERTIMNVKTYTEARASLAKLMDQVCEDHDAVIITRQGGKPVVMMSLEDWNGWRETEYLQRSPANREALREALAEAERGEGRIFESIEAMVRTAEAEVAARKSGPTKE